MSNVLVTGANGFIGDALVRRLNNEDFTCQCVIRSPRPYVSSNNWSDIVVGDIDGATNWSGALGGVDTVVHLAARVHVMKEHASDALSEFCRVNVDGTERLACHAADAGVKRFVYLSSIKVNGETTDGRKPFSEFDEPAPEDPYGISKWRAEQALCNAADKTGMEVVIIRPPLVYGPGVKANFLKMIQWLNRGVPLPLGAIHNRRSLIALDNLVDLISVCIQHPAAANQTFLAADREDLSTTELIERLALALGKPARLLRVPAWLLKLGAGTLGKRTISQRLCGSLQVSNAKAHSSLNWTPPTSVDEALAVTAQHFLASQFQ